MKNLQFPFAHARGGKVDSMGQVRLGKSICTVLVFCAAAVVALPAQVTFTTLASFDGMLDSQYGSLVQGIDGNFYGETAGGGANFWGAIFKITPGGTLTTLHSFAGSPNEGGSPYGGLVQATNGDFYGTTEEGGTNNYGTVFKITPGGTLTTLHSFAITDGMSPYAGLVQATNGNLYGTTLEGGAIGYGTIFQITPEGTLTTLHSFDYTDGEEPNGGLVQASNGDFYGTTAGGGANGVGTVFKITPGGTLTTLHSFDGTDGDYPDAPLVQASNGDLYGTAYTAGAYGYGTVFKITPSGTFTTLLSFCSVIQNGVCTDGEYPYTGLTQATDGNLYGTTFSGGAQGYGSAYRITPGGKLTTLYSFCSKGAYPECTDGDSPLTGLVQATNGNFYGTTLYGGANDLDGTVFSLSVGLGPFVETRPTSGKVGATVILLGNNVKGASVSFNGTPATVISSTASAIKTTVPTGATTGTVTVTTSSGTLDSNVEFRLTPQITSFSPASGPAGTVVTITGVGLTQTTAVTFGGVKATSFTVNSDTQVTATVPTGAITGKIGITTKGGTATSATSFTVTT
jgi:uncharacterized repeat protein (TIGR03803 family)